MPDNSTHTRGRKAYTPMESALVIMLMHVREGRGLLFSGMSATLAYRLTDNLLRRIGITPQHDGQKKWYDRLWQCVDRIVNLIDAFPGPKKQIPKDGE